MLETLKRDHPTITKIHIECSEKEIPRARAAGLPAAGLWAGAVLEADAATRGLTLPLREGQNREAVLGRGRGGAVVAYPSPKTVLASLRVFSARPQGAGYRRQPLIPAVNPCMIRFCSAK